MNTKNTHSNGAQPPHWLSEEDRVTRFTIKTLNPAGVLGFSPICVTANETDRVATITVHRRQGGDGEVTVDYFSTDGTARSNVNYAPVSGTLTFPPSVTYQTFTVSLADDGVANSPLTIHLVDLMAQMGKNLTGVLKDDPQLAVFRSTDFIEEMVKRGWWGEKKG